VRVKKSGAKTIKKLSRKKGVDTKKEQTTGGWVGGGGTWEYRGVEITWEYKSRKFRNKSNREGLKKKKKREIVWTQGKKADLDHNMPHLITPVVTH